MSRVAVVGAGAAGLMAALELKAAGQKPTVFEARSRVGGRIHTVRFARGLWANAGAEWLNESDVLAHELVEKYGLGLTPRYGYEALVFEDTLHPAPEFRDASIQQINRALDELAATLTNFDEPWNDPAAVAMDQLSVAEWVCQLDGIDPDARDTFFDYIRAEFMVEPEKLSLRARVVEQALVSGTGYARFTDGTAVLSAAMAHDLGAGDIQLDTPVSAVTQSPDGVTISTERGEYGFDAVILAVPLPTLPRIVVTPPQQFPELGFGRGGKMLVPYADRAWEDADARAAAHGGGHYVYNTASHQERADGVLVAYSAEVLSQDGVVAAFATWFPGLGTPTEAPVAAWWSEQPDTGLTYSAPRPGDLAAIKRLREPFGRIYLAGEHTEMPFGYIESALMSGRRTARAVMAALRP